MAQWGWGGWGGRRGGGRGGGWGRGYGLGRQGAAPMPEVPPPAPGVYRIVIATEGRSGLNDIVAYRFGRAPFFTVVDASGDKVVSVRVYENPVADAPGGVGVRIAQWLVSIRCKTVVGPRFGPNASFVLSQAGIRMELAPPGTPVRVVLARLGIHA